MGCDMLTYLSPAANFDTCLISDIIWDGFAPIMHFSCRQNQCSGSILLSSVHAHVVFGNLKTQFSVQGYCPKLLQVVTRISATHGS